MHKDKPMKRSAVTGHALGKRAQRAEDKNELAAERFVTAVLKNTHVDGVTLARVLRTSGGGHVTVRLYTDQEGVFKIAGRIAFRGRAATKADRGCCVLIDDYVIVDGAHIISKVPLSLVAALRGDVAFSMMAPKNFFAESVVEPLGGEDGWEFDRAEEGEEVDIDAI